MEAYRIAAQKAMDAVKQQKKDEADIAERQMSAIRELEEARIEIFRRLDVPDIEIPTRQKREVIVDEESNGFVSWLSSTLKEKGLTRRKLARTAGVSEAHLSRIINGRQGLTSDMRGRLEESLLKSVKPAL